MLQCGYLLRWKASNKLCLFRNWSNLVLTMFSINLEKADKKLIRRYNFRMLQVSWITAYKGQIDSMC